jgi:hypothetical protein
MGQLPWWKPYFTFLEEQHGKHPYRPRHRRRLRPPARRRAVRRVAAADNGIALADDGSNAGVATLSGVIFDNYGNSATTQQQANGSGASNQSNTAQVKGSPFTVINQGNQNTAVTFAPLWW